jgi:hypothetical protein
MICKQTWNKQESKRNAEINLYGKQFLFRVSHSVLRSMGNDDAVGVFVTTMSYGAEFFFV